MIQRLRDLLPERLIRGLHETRRLGWRLKGRKPAGPQPPPVPPNQVRLLIGPANFAGQAGAWAAASRRHLSGVTALSMAVSRGGLEFPTDYSVSIDWYRSKGWAVQQQSWIVSNFTHLLIDAMRPLAGSLEADDCRRELPRFRAAGLTVGLIAHGSEIRLPSLHRSLYAESPFDPKLAATRRLQAQVERVSPIFTAFDGPTFVSTPDLLDFAPRATWLPVVVEPESWVSELPLLRRRRPVVLHIPSNPFLKGSRLIDPVLAQLDRDGVIEYRRLERVSPAQMPQLVAEADVVLDQFVLGLYSAMAIQAMFAGRLVVAHVHERVRARIPEPLPVVESTVTALVDTLKLILRDRDHYRAVAEAGNHFAHRFHDGRRSAEVLGRFLGAPPASAPTPHRAVS